MAEMLIQSESLTGIADKIRVLSGTTGAMSLDAMETNVGDANTEISSQSDLLTQVITALENKAAGSDLTPIVDALTEKGVTVPDGTKVDGLAALIASIESGGGIDFGNGVNVISGTVTPATDALTLTIGQKIPSNKRHVLIVVDDAFNTNSSRGLTIGVFLDNYKVYSECFGFSNSSATCTLSVDLETGTYTCSNTYWLFGGNTYHWMVICGK